MVEMEFSPRNARRPLSSSYSTAPKLKTSERASSGLPSACSGAIYAAVPITVPSMVAVSSESVTCLASPKSSSFTEPSVVTMMLAGFRSRCTTPLRCAASRASAIWIASRTASSTDAGLERAALDVLEHQVIRADVVDLADVGMIQRGDRARLLLEPRVMLALQPFDRDDAIQAGVAGFPHLAHAAGADGSD